MENVEAGTEKSKKDLSKFSKDYRLREHWDNSSHNPIGHEDQLLNMVSVNPEQKGLGLRFGIGQVVDVWCDRNILVKKLTMHWH